MVERLETTTTTKADEFSFPSIALHQDSFPFPHFAASPLWFLPSRKADRRIGADGRREEASRTVVDVEAAVGGRGQALGDEERMDVLWEDFNEELHRRMSRSGRRRKAWGSQLDAAAHNNGMAELQALSESKSGGCIVRRSRPSLILILKVLKKLFLIQKAGSSSRRNRLSAKPEIF